MSARPSWSLDDINPKVRERAEDSARRAGMSVGDWLNATIGDAAASLGRSPFDNRDIREPSRETMTAQQRLDSIAKQFDPGTRTPKPDILMNAEPSSRADARLAHYTESAATARNANPYGPRSSGAISLEAAIAEISARQQELAAPGADARTLVPSSKLSTLERQISHIMTQMESLPNPGLIEESIASFRADLSDIRKTITEAMPRRAIESIESEVRTLSQRIDESRERGADANALAGVERGLDQIRDSLKTLMPAEQLAGFDEAIRNLANQLDTVVRSGSDATVLNQLEEAIASLRVIVTKVASNEALSSLGGDVRTLAGKLDEFANSGGFGESLAALETRIVSLASFLQKRDRAEGHGEGAAKVETALRELSSRIEHMPPPGEMPLGYDGRMAALLDRLEAISTNPGLIRVEEGLQDIRQQLEDRRALLETTEDMPARVLDPTLVDTVKRELADIRFSLTASDRHTLQSLEVVNNTLGHVVDRLAMIEGDLRGQTVQPNAPAAPLAAAAAMAQNLFARPEMPRPEMQNPAASRALHDMDAPPLQPRALAPELPPDTPLEPGTRSAGRIADEIESLADEPPQDGATTSGFIAAARRAARAAAAAAPQNDKPKRAAAAADEAGGSTIASKIRSLLVGASVVMIVIGSFRMAMTLLDGAAPPSLELPPSAISAPVKPDIAMPPPGKQSSLLAPDPLLAIPSSASNSDVTGSIKTQAVAEPARLADPALALARVNIPANETLPETIGSAKLRDAALKGDAGAAFEVGVRFAEAQGVAVNFIEAAKWYDRAAQAGIAPAAFRLGAMYEKGVGVNKDLGTARRYYQQAADRGNAKAMHNLAVLDADGGGSGANFKAASQWFRKAAERGIVDSQYNLGILYARGIGVEQNLAESFKWFSLAAAQGDVDSAGKRDDVAKKIDPQSLSAAKLAIQTFTPEPQPPEATNVAVPAKGWDAAPLQTANAKPVAPVRKRPDALTSGR